MNKNLKKIFGVMTVVGAVFALSSCNSFCSEVDVSNYLYAYDPINTTFFESTSDGTDHILETFKKQNNVDPERVTKENLRIYEYNETTLQFEKKTYDENEVFTKINDGLVSLNPIKLVVHDGSKKDEKTGNRNDISYVFGLSDATTQFITQASNTGLATPSYNYWKELDKKFLKTMESKVSTASWLEGVNLSNITYTQMYGYSADDLKTFRADESNSTLKNQMIEGKKTSDGKIDPAYPGRNHSFLTTLGHFKYYVASDNENKDIMQHVINWNNELVNEGLCKPDEVMSSKYLDFVRMNLNQRAAGFRTCISMDDGFYGHIGNDPLNHTIPIEGKGKDFYQGWGEAFAKHGVLEGLFVYPIAALVENLSHALGMNGYGQIGAVLIATVIIRLLFMLVTLPSTISQQKMSYLQPEMAKLQQKYPNSDTNQYEKQKMAQAQMALYKKYKIHPFASLLIVFIQFPVFISVWNAMTGSASLSSDAVLGLRLSDTIASALGNFNNWPANGGWWTALVLIILMSAAQICSMFVPQWLNKRRMKSVAKVGKSSAVTQQNKTMKWTQWIMTGMIIIMGFSLPSAMGVYWFAGALFSIIQSVILHFVFLRKQQRRKDK